MPLPKLNEEVKSKKIKLLNGKEVGIKPWRVKEEKELMFATDGVKDKVIISKEILDLIAKCVDNCKVEELSESLVNQISLELRKISKGNVVEFGYTCSACGTKNQGEIDLDKDVTSRAFDSSPIDLGKGLVIKLKEVPLVTLLELKQKFTKPSEFNHNLLVNSIDTVSLNGEAYTNFTLEEASEFVDDMKTDPYNELMEKMISKMSFLVVMKSSSCVQCKKESNILFDNVTDFFGF